MPFSPPGSGLFLGLSFNVVVEEVGVPWADVLGEFVLPCGTSVELEPAGEAVPVWPSFLFFDLLLDSRALESCAPWVSQSIRLYCEENIGMESRHQGACDEETYHSLFESLHVDHSDQLIQSSPARDAR